MAVFEGQSKGQGLYIPMTVLHFRLCTSVHRAQCALSCGYIASCDEYFISVNRP
jgi:hypothetical protein